MPVGKHRFESILIVLYYLDTALSGYESKLQKFTRLGRFVSLEQVVP